LRYVTKGTLYVPVEYGSLLLVLVVDHWREGVCRPVSTPLSDSNKESSRTVGSPKLTVFFF